jgi:hypothetical protein
VATSHPTHSRVSNNAQRFPLTTLTHQARLLTLHSCRHSRERLTAFKRRRQLRAGVARSLATGPLPAAAPIAVRFWTPILVSAAPITSLQAAAHVSCMRPTWCCAWCHAARATRGRALHTSPIDTRHRPSCAHFLSSSCSVWRLTLQTAPPSHATCNHCVRRARQTGLPACEVHGAIIM